MMKDDEKLESAYNRIKFLYELGCVPEADMAKIDKLHEDDHKNDRQTEASFGD